MHFYDSSIWLLRWFILSLTAQYGANLCADWLPVRVKWAHLARYGLPDFIPRKKKSYVERTYKVCKFWKMFAMEMQKAAVDSHNTQIIKLSWVYCAINMVGFLSRFSKLTSHSWFLISESICYIINPLLTTGSVKMTRYSPRFFFLSRFYGTKVYHNSTVRTTSYDQEVFLGQNQVSDLFCGDDETKLNFFCICSLTIVMSKYLQRPLQASSKIISGTDHSWIYPMSPVNQEVWWLRWLGSFVF